MLTLDRRNYCYLDSNYYGYHSYPMVLYSYMKREDIKNLLNCGNQFLGEKLGQVNRYILILLVA